MAKKWYVIHTQTGHEEKIKLNIEKRAKEISLERLISQILIPTEKVSEVRSGKKKISFRKFFPGYVLIEMELSDKLWYLIKTTPGVTGFIGLGRKPMPLPEKEVENILKKTQDTQVKPSPKVVFEKNEQVRVTEGPFINFNGTIEEVHPEKGKIKVMVSVFGRSTPVELDFMQIDNT